MRGDYPDGRSKTITGRRSEEIVGLLGYHYGDVVVHRNDLVLL